MPRVLIIQYELKHYRLPFFIGLHKALQRDNIDLKILYSNSHPQLLLSKDGVDLPPAVGHKVTGLWFFKKFIYQPIWKEIFSADLVITGSELKYLINPLLLLMSALKLKRVAFWGLGPNKHPTRSEFAETIKKPFFTCVDWWFAYTESIAEYMKKEGMPGNRITIVQNASDSAESRRLIAEISAEEVLQAKIALTGTSEARIGLYCGLLGKIKDLPLLIETARLVKQRCPQFHLVLIGDGPDRPWLENAIAGDPWIHHLGFMCGRERALYYKMADISLIAGTAGLGVVDAFAAGLPFIATKLPTHPPEITYVIDGKNGRIAPHEPKAFAAAILEVLSDPEMMERLRSGARASGAKYTMEAMVENYRAGIKSWMAMYGSSRVLDVADSQLPPPRADSC
jgi:glycosyltransferase involved in cell wall biosynthesis